MCIYIYTHTHTRTHTRLALREHCVTPGTYMYICIYISTSVYVCIKYIDKQMYMLYTHTHILSLSLSLSFSLSLSLFLYLALFLSLSLSRTHTHTHIHPHTLTHTHTHTHTRRQLSHPLSQKYNILKNQLATQCTAQKSLYLFHLRHLRMSSLPEMLSRFKNQDLEIFGSRWYCTEESITLWYQ